MVYYYIKQCISGILDVFFFFFSIILEIFVFQEILCEKRKKLTEQHNDAKQLKESIDKRQKTVSEILAGYFDQDQFADYEHYIKMKSALIMEQRELDDKTKLGQEQMQCLRDSLPEEWQNNLDQLLEE